MRPSWRSTQRVGIVAALAWLATAAVAVGGPPPVRNPAGMRNPAGPSPRNPAGPPPTDPTGSFSHLRPIRPPGARPPSRPGAGGHGGHGHHGGWNGGNWGYPGYYPGVVVIGPTWSGGFPYGSNFYCQVHGIGFAFQDMFLEHIAYVDGVAPDYAMTQMFNSGGVWVFSGAW